MDKDHLIKLIEEQGLSDSEIRIIVKMLKSKKSNVQVKPLFNGLRKIKFGLMSDLHIGHKNFRCDVLATAADVWKKQGVKIVFNSGDTLEGMSNREGHVFELDHIGYKAQLNHFKDVFDAIMCDFEVYSIESDHSHSAWCKNKGNMGFDIGEIMQDKASNYRFLGYDFYDVPLTKYIYIRLYHPGGGTAYALSYKAQKYISTMNKFGFMPHMIFQGHYHKAGYYPLGCHVLDSACMEDTTLFMQKMQTYACVGFWTIEVGIKGNEVISFKPEYTSFKYKKKNNSKMEALFHDV